MATVKNSECSFCAQLKAHRVSTEILWRIPPKNDNVITKLAVHIYRPPVSMYSSGGWTETIVFNAQILYTGKDALVTGQSKDPQLEPNAPSSRYLFGGYSDNSNPHVHFCIFKQK